MENSNRGYDALLKLDLEMREKHHKLIQVQDRVANLRRIKEQLIKEHGDAKIRNESLTLKCRAILARRQTCQVRLETLNKEIENELQPEYNKLLQRVQQRQKKKDYILQFQAEKLAEMDQIFANNLAHYKSMPMFAEYEKKKDKLEELKFLTNGQRATLAMLKEKLVQRRALEEDKWSKFKAICIEAAQNWKTRMEREKRSSTLGRAATKFSKLSLFNSTISRTAPALPSSTWRSDQTRIRTSTLPNPFFKSKGKDNNNNDGGGVKFGGFGDAWRNLTKSQTARAVPYSRPQQTRSRNTSLPNPGVKSYASALKGKEDNNKDGANSRRSGDAWQNFPKRQESNSNSQESTSSLASEGDETNFSIQSRHDHSDLDEDIFRSPTTRPLESRINSQESTSSLAPEDSEPNFSPQYRQDISNLDEQRSTYRPLDKEKHQESSSLVSTNGEPEFPTLSRPDRSKSNEDRSTSRRSLASNKENCQESAPQSRRDFSALDGQRSAYRSSLGSNKENCQESTSALTSKGDEQEPGFPPQSRRDRSKLDEGVFRRPITPPTKDHPFSLPFSGFSGEIESGSKSSAMPFPSFSDQTGDMGLASKDPFSGGEMESGSKESFFPFSNQTGGMGLASKDPFAGGEMESKGSRSFFPFLDQTGDMDMSSQGAPPSSWIFAPMSPASSEGSYEGGFEFFNFGSKDKDDDLFDFSKLARNKDD